MIVIKRGSGIAKWKGASLRGVNSAAAALHTSSQWWHQGGSHVALVWRWKGTVPHQALVFLCEAVWLLLHNFSNHLGNPLGCIPLSVWSTPSYSLVLWLSRGHVGLGSRLHLHVQVWMCYFVLCKETGKARIQFYCFNLSWCPSLQIVLWADHVL